MDDGDGEGIDDDEDDEYEDEEEYYQDPDENQYIDLEDNEAQQDDDEDEEEFENEYQEETTEIDSIEDQNYLGNKRQQYFYGTDEEDEIENLDQVPSQNLETIDNNFESESNTVITRV